MPSARTILTPGRKKGAPCRRPCAHPECALNHKMAALVCVGCGEAIGYEAWFYLVGSEPLAGAHAACYWGWRLPVGGAET